jgi:hypothetical protein
MDNTEHPATITAPHDGTGAPVDHADDPKTAQVRAQCHVVALLADRIGKVHREYAEHLPTETLAGIADEVGPRTAALMEFLGDTASEIDVISLADAFRTDPVFEMAHKMFPLPTEPSAPEMAAEIERLRGENANTLIRCNTIITDLEADNGALQAEIARLTADRAKLVEALEEMLATHPATYREIRLARAALAAAKEG